MPTSSVTARSLALALLGLGVAPAAIAQGSNVAAFNPYSGVGLPGGPVPQYGPQAAYPIVDTVGPAAGGPAFNPWQPGAGVSAGYPVSVGAVSVGAVSVGAVSVGAVSAGMVSAGVPASVYSYNPGAYLPAPPPGPIESRMVAIPELSTAPSRRESYTPTYLPPAPPPPVAPPVAARVEPATAATPTPVPPPTRPVAVPIAPLPTGPGAAAPAPAAPATAVPTPAPTTPPARAAAAFSSLPQDLVPPPKGTIAATIAFSGQSADLNEAGRTDLDRLAKNLGDRSLRQIEIRAYAGGADAESRKISLARALVVRSYLIDKGVKARIEVGAYGGDSRGGNSDRVDILVPNS